MGFPFPRRSHVFGGPAFQAPPSRALIRIPALALALALALVSAQASPVDAEETHVAVRVISKDAKFVGTSMGGVAITLRDADTGRLLAEGLTAGSTGDTARIMTEPRRRGVPLSTPGSAMWEATMDLERPVLLEVSAFGPQGQRQGANRVSITQWVVPGKHLTGGDGVLLELPGMVVDVLAPASHSRHEAPLSVPVEVNVTMMCGCPLTPGGLWDSGKFEIRALVYKDGERAPDLDRDLAYAGTASRFAVDLELDEPGVYEVLVYAYDAANGNTGLDRTTFLVSGS